MENGATDSMDHLGANQRGARSKEAKGNVLVSVRVRPDTGANENSRTEGEWMVDGRRSLIAFRGKESYDYIYGKNPCDTQRNLFTNCILCQIMFLRPMTTTPKFMIRQPSV